MKRIGVVVWVLLASMVGSGIQRASAQQLENIDATKYGDTPLNVYAQAGTYLITPVDSQTYTGAQFTAWDPIGGSSSSTWINSLWVFDGNGNIIGSLGDFTNVFSTPQEAFSDPLNLPITVTTTGGIGFGVDDNYLPDNLGGISLTFQLVSATPEPGSLALLSGLVFSGSFVLLRYHLRRSSTGKSR